MLQELVTMETDYLYSRGREIKQLINRLTNWPLRVSNVRLARFLLSFIGRGGGSQYAGFARIVRTAEKEIRK